MLLYLCSRIVYSDLNSITPEQYFKQVNRRIAEIKAVSVSISISFPLTQSLMSPCCNSPGILTGADRAL